MLQASDYFLLPTSEPSSPQSAHGRTLNSHQHSGTPSDVRGGNLKNILRVCFSENFDVEYDLINISLGFLSNSKGDTSNQTNLLVA